MKNKFLRLLCLLISACLFPFGGVAMAEELISAEELVSYCGLENEGISMDDLAEIIRRYRYTPDYVARISGKDLGESLKRLLDSDFRNNYQYLFYSPALEASLSDLKAESIKRIAVYTQMEMKYETALVDFESGLVYADIYAYFLQDITQAKITRPAESDARETLYRLIAGIAWPEPVSGDDHSGTPDNGSNYGIAVETEDGVIRKVYHSGTETNTAGVIHDIMVFCAGDQY